MLKISTKTSEGIPIDIDGERYEMKSYDSLKFQDFFELQKFANTFDKFKDLSTAKLSKDQITSMEESLDVFCEKILPGVPKNIMNAVNYMAKIQIIETFMTTVPQKVEESTANLKKSSQGSFGSTVSAQESG
jgi:hypothetical protein